MWFYAMIVILLAALVWITRIREGFIDKPEDALANLPDPHTMFKKMRELLDKYDKPEIWGHAAEVMDKGPGQLARMNLNITNSN